ncbi:MAG: hypothetical protein WBN34_13495 [Woeseia sp.]
MKKTICAFFLLLPLSVSAEHMDVIRFQLDEGCTFATFMEITAAFNDWGKAYGYHAKVAMPLQSDDLVSLFWLGTTKDAATYGKAWDAWRDALSDANSTPAKLWARFEDCSTNLGRWGYDVY